MAPISSHHGHVHSESRNGNSDQTYTARDYIPEPSAFADTLANRYQLDRHQTIDLHSMVHLGSTLERGDLLLRIASNALLFNVQNTMAEILKKEELTSQALQDLKKPIVNDWNPTQIQKDNVLTCVKDNLIDPNIASYTYLPEVVMRALKRDVENFQLTDVFSKVDRVQKLEKIVRANARSVLNQMRRHILESVNSNVMPLEELTQFLWHKFKADKTDDIIPTFTVKVAMMRRFALENPDVKKEEDMDDNPFSTTANFASAATVESDDEDSDQPASKRKRKNDGKASDGRAKKVGFWKNFDAFMDQKKEKFGKNLDSSGWRSYIEETLKKDRENSSKLTTYHGPVFDSIADELEEHLNSQDDTRKSTTTSSPEPARFDVTPSSTRIRAIPTYREPVTTSLTDSSLAFRSPPAPPLASGRSIVHSSPASTPVPSSASQYPATHQEQSFPAQCPKHINAPIRTCVHQAQPVILPLHTIYGTNDVRLARVFPHSSSHRPQTRSPSMQDSSPQCCSLRKISNPVMSSASRALPAEGLRTAHNDVVLPSFAQFRKYNGVNEKQYAWNARPRTP